MLEIAVIGAGASALAASRHLAGLGMRPCIFEAARNLGGAWSSAPTRGSDNNHNHHYHRPSKMWNGMTTNLSKHTCRFSELPWPEDTPTFPTVIDMGNYLESYAQQFLDPSYFQYQCKVTNIESLSPQGIDGKYRVEWTDLSTSTKHSKEFEGVVVSTGFFSKPNYPAELDMDHPLIQKHVLHSADYESSAAFVNQTVAVVGSSFSALEIAVDVSSVAKRVVHVVPTIPWVIPRYIPHQKTSKTVDGTTSADIILPVDLAFYRRPKDGPQTPEQTILTPEMITKRHEYMYSIVGKRQEQSPLGIPTGIDWEKPPMVAISDYYLDLTIQGDIEIVRGRFQGMDMEQGSSNNIPTWRVQTPTGQSHILENIDKVICCTGYESNLQDYLHPDILETLQYDPSDTHAPMVTCWDTLHPALPNLFFCGMYRGPYMGVMEIQGRLAAGVLSGKVKLEDSNLQQALETSKQIRTQQPRPQFPHFDYIGHMDSLVKVLGESGFPKTNNRKGDMISPAFYQEDTELAQKEAEELKEEVKRGMDASQIPRLVLSAIIGDWEFDRRIVHFSNDRQEHVYGSVRYTRPALDHVLYREDGFYELSSTQTLNVFREYEYQVSGDCLELYFVEGGQRAHLFLSLKFSQKEGDYWVATSDHLCIKDLYQANFRVRLDGLAATEIQMTYRVKGPAKDYESTTILTPKQAIPGMFN